jgi:hypothetical protein
MRNEEGFTTMKLIQQNHMQAAIRKLIILE